MFQNLIENASIFISSFKYLNPNKYVYKNTKILIYYLDIKDFEISAVINPIVVDLSLRKVQEAYPPSCCKSIIKQKYHCIKRIHHLDVDLSSNINITAGSASTILV